MKCTSEFSAWIDKLDRSLAIRIDQRLQRLDGGNPGLHKRFDNLLELKWRAGTMGSFRVYCLEIEDTIVLLGGHKDTQSKDIEKAKKLAIGVKNGSVRTKVYE